MTEMNHVISIGSDHAGFPLKKYLVEKLIEKGFKIKDYGTFSEESVDYPDFVHPVAFDVENGICEKAIIVCGSGQGANMTANKYPHVRSALCWNVEQARLSRQHNNANIIAFPGRFISFEDALEATIVFFNTNFEGGRHQTRVEKISQILI